MHSKFPKISIVTPSYNQGEFIEETIQSVLSQDYPNFEYIIIDGGSNDKSVDVIQKYEKHLSYWTSEPDHGQSHAINKGFSRATGEIYGYINSDDLYESNAFRTIADLFKSSDQIQMIAGSCIVFKTTGEENLFKPWRPQHLSYFLKPFGSPFSQPASFWRRNLHEEIGGFDDRLHYAFDREFFLKAGLSGVRPEIINRVLARYRDHEQTKTRNTIKFYEEAIPIIERYGSDCGLSSIDIQRRLRRVRNDIEYLRIFQCWREAGRGAAIVRFLDWSLKSPSFLIDRKVLGQARRLISFTESKVAELKRS